MWANNPLMVALVDALSCFDVPRECVCILSLGCGNRRYTVGRSRPRSVTPSHGETSCSQRCVCSPRRDWTSGPPDWQRRITRVDVPANAHGTALDDWSRALQTCHKQARKTFASTDDAWHLEFFKNPAALTDPLTRESHFSHGCSQSRSGFVRSLALLYAMSRVMHVAAR